MGSSNSSCQVVVFKFIEGIANEHVESDGLTGESSSSPVTIIAIICLDSFIACGVHANVKGHVHFGLCRVNSVARRSVTLWLPRDVDSLQCVTPVGGELVDVGHLSSFSFCKITIIFIILIQMVLMGFWGFGVFFMMMMM